MVQKIKTVICIIFGIIGFLHLSGCGSQKAKEVNIGIVAPITGEAATFGTSMVNGSKLYLDKINDGGGINGLKIKTFVEDDKGDPAEGANAWSKLIDQNKVSVIIGTVMTKVSLAGAPISQEKGIPMVTPTSTNPAVTLVGDFIYRTCFIDDFQGFVAAKWSINKGFKIATVLYDAGNDYSKGLSEVFKAEFMKMGGTVLAFESYSTATTDFNAQLVKIKNVNPEVIFLPNYYNDVGLIAKQARDMGITAQLLGGDGWDSPDLFKIGGASVDGGVFVSHFTFESDAPATKQFVSDYVAKYGQKPDAIAALAYEASMVVVDAIKKGGTDPNEIKAALAKTDLETITGTIKFDENRNPVKGAVLLRVQGAKIIFEGAINP